MASVMGGLIASYQIPSLMGGLIVSDQIRDGDGRPDCV
jgi:hypothetical protein